MDEFLAVTFSFPTVVFTVLGIVAIVYWMSVLLGMLDIDALEFDLDADGAVEGAGDIGDVGDVDVGDVGDVDADLPEGADAGDSGDGEGTGASGFAALLSALRLRHAPLTVTFSVLILVAWLASYFGARYLAPIVPGPDVAGALVTMLAAVAVALPTASFLTRPLGRFFVTHAAQTNSDLIGKVVTLRVPTLEGNPGQAVLDDGGADLLLRVRAVSEEELSRGSRALIVSYDEGRDTFEVEPMEGLLGDGEQGQAGS